MLAWHGKGLYLTARRDFSLALAVGLALVRTGTPVCFTGKVAVDDN
jgi:hypothetical protein